MLKLNKNTSSTVQIIDQISERLGEINQLPQYCDLSQIGPLHMASIYSAMSSDTIISHTVQCGMDFDQDLSIVKALVERVERLAIESGNLADHPACQTPRSDGFAAFPSLKIGQIAAKHRARMNAYGEALERYAWATWWDNFSVGATVRRNNEVFVSRETSNLIGEVQKILPTREVVLIEPKVEGEFGVMILYFILENGGVVSGGASGFRSDRDSTLNRGLGELARHMISAKKILAGAVPSDFYERRLSHMVSTTSSERLKDRLLRAGEDYIDLPKLQFDESIPHTLSDVAAVHRCLFENQPPFVGGALERLCL